MPGMSPMSKLLVAQHNAKTLLDINETLSRLADTKNRAGSPEVYRDLINALNNALAYESEQIVESVSAKPKLF